jgi:CSLREA domain-containing protein
MLKNLSAIAVGSLIVLALGAPAARPALAAPVAATFNVNSTLDEIDDSPGDGLCHSLHNHCTLRAAVMEANFSSGAGATIIVPAGIYTLTIPASGGDGASTGDLNLTTPPPSTATSSPASGPSIALFGAGAASTIIDANQADRVLSVGHNRTASLSGLTLRDGYIEGAYGGGLANDGTLTVTRSTLSGNQSVTPGDGGGGAINSGALTLIESTVTANSALSAGGGLYNSGTLLVLRSTIAGNHAGYGAGIFNTFLDSLILVDSTVSGNDAVTNGGGIDNVGQANLYSTTIAGNWADADRQGAGAGGGVYNAPPDQQGVSHAAAAAIFNMRNVLLVGNNLGDTPEWDDCDGTLDAYGTDIVGLQGEPTVCTINQPAGGNLYKLNSLNALGGLRDNGGPTWTIALLAGSSAIMDGGNPVTCLDENAQLLATDQRGVARVAGGNCDIGAFEFLPPAAFLPFVRR